MTAFPPDTFDPMPGLCETLELGVRRILAPNPSPMTCRGTNTYVIGTRALAVIDPGPMDEDHLAAILNSVGEGQRISHIIVTHTHLDHSPLSAPLSQHTGAPVLAFGTAKAGRSAIMQKLSAAGFASGGEGIDHGFTPDQTVADGDRIEGDGWVLEVLHTPGHLGNHICLAWGDICFTADHVMGWASSLVSPPDGDLTDFMKSCRRLQSRVWRQFFPGHGAAIDTPASRLEWLVQHRLDREAAVIAAMKNGARTPTEITAQVYSDTPAAMWPAAERNVLAHLIDLLGKSYVTHDGDFSSDGQFFWAGRTTE